MATNHRDQGMQGAERPRRRSFARYCFILLLAGAVLLAWLSLLTFSPTDPPSHSVYAPDRPVSNAAGRVGAHLAYHLRYWLGGGAYMGLLFATVAAGILVLGGRVGEIPWRIIGVSLLIVATSSGAYMLNPAGADPVLTGSAGVLGTGVGELLSARFARIGTWVLLTLTLCTGLMLSADQLVLQLPRLGRKVWDRRGQIPALLDSLRRRRTVTTAEAGAVGVTRTPRAAAAAPAAARRAPAPRPAPARPPAPPPARPAPPEKPAVAEKAAEARPADAPAADAPDKPAKKPLRLLPFLRPRQAEAKEPAPAAAPAPRDDASDKRRKDAPGEKGKYELPSPELLMEPTGGYSEAQELNAVQKKHVLQQTLNDFNVSAEVVGFMTGPVITLFELSLAPGVKVAQIANLANDIARALAVPGVRIVSPIPGKDTVGIEVPNLDKEIVRIKELMGMAPQAETKMAIPLYLGKDAGGGPIVADLAEMPHMLIAGTTGSGKSVCINAIIMAILMTRSPDEVRLILVDPKMVEMAAFENVPHLLCPIITDMRKAEDILEWAVTRMDERYELLRDANVKNIAGFNRLSREELWERLGAETEEERAHVPRCLPHYVIIVDELADLIMTSDKDIENHIIRIAQKARAVGIHLILATQRPSVNVVTGLIKSNMPCRISFRVASRQESRIVLDQNGADVLLGQGDMLFLPPGTSVLVRAQGTYVDEAEIRSVVKALRQAGEPNYEAELLRINSAPSGEGASERDELFDKAAEIVLATQRGSVSLLQRRLQIGYSRASRIIDQMADAGLLGDYKGSQARECLVTLEDWQAMQKSIAADQSGESAANGEPTSV